LAVPDHTVAEIPPLPSPVSTSSEERNSVLFPIQSETPEEEQSPPSNTPVIL
jgi:hypothetical protein